MGRMGRTRFIGLRISETDFRKIEAMRNGRTITQFFKDLVRAAVANERAEAESFLKLLEKINNSDLSKIAEKVERIELVEKYLKRIYGESIRANIAVEELAKRRLGRSDFFQQFLNEIENRLEAKRQAGGK